MVDILKIKDENGDWVTVQAFQGQTGLTPHISIGQVEAGATPSDAAASMSGTREFPFLNLTLPRGYTGEPGVAIASSEPQTDQLVWIDTNSPTGTKTIPEIDDEAVNFVDTWSSAKIRDFIYPIGSIYLSVNSTSPATIFGGTWEQIQDTFLLAAGSTYAAGSSGGEATVKLDYSNYQYGVWSPLPPSPADITSGFSGITGGYGINTQYTNNDNQPHNNMPPYLAIYVWKRTA